MMMLTDLGQLSNGIKGQINSSQKAQGQSSDCFSQTKIVYAYIPFESDCYISIMDVKWK